MSDQLEAALRAADTVVFDFDGVLADSEPLHLRSYRELMAADGGGIVAASWNQNVDHGGPNCSPSAASR